MRIEFTLEMLLLLGLTGLALALLLFCWGQGLRLRNLQGQLQGLGQGLEAQKELQLRAMLRLQKGFMAQGSELARLFEQRLGDIQLGLVERFDQLERHTSGQLAESRIQQQEALAALQATLQRAFAEHREQVEQRQSAQSLQLQQALQQGLESSGRQLGEGLSRNNEELGRQMQQLRQTTEQRLGEISQQVEQRLNEGFEKTTATFAQVLQHLSRIDEAQKRIAELSSNVVSLQEVLSDKRSRGAFGEIQLNGLIRNLIPERNFSLQYSLSNGNRVDCMLHLPDPTGNVPIDAKFPLEGYRRLSDEAQTPAQRELAAGQFRRDIRKHIHDIASRYLIPGETAEGAVMFIPAEAVFAEIHGRFPELVEEAHARRVWLVSPTTLMAVLTTARAVLKDAETRQQVHVIQDHLNGLSQDFARFRKRMDNLARHIDQAGRDVSEIHSSAEKISRRFERIEKVELGAEDGEDNALPVPNPDKAGA
ncbi:DNA recombination protein RmuC [Magnetovirga frankeli]|uniref:DNA recombination protein RmuC n=1 Tax=Magnetovirga frankeli TaxID=947516 RepID=UPI003D33E1E4